MALKIISNEVKDDFNHINYPCLMECIDESWPDDQCIVLAIGDAEGISVVDTSNPERIGTITDDWYSFSDKKYWKPYNRAVTFCNK